MLGCVTAIPLLLVILYGIGQTSGTEFSPDDFSRRNFYYNQTPYFDWVITGKTYSDATRPFDQSLVIDGFVVPVVNVNKSRTWHLVSDSGSSESFMSAGCDARFLTSFLDLTDDEGEDYWLGWNERHPNAAKIFWPRVAELARNEMYLKIPDIMQFAMEYESDDAKLFSRELDALVSQSYLELGQIDLELKRFERAESRIQLSIRHRTDGNPTGEAEELLALCRSRMDLKSNSGQAEREPEPGAVPQLESAVVDEGDQNGANE